MEDMTNWPIEIWTLKSYHMHTRSCTDLIFYLGIASSPTWCASALLGLYFTTITQQPTYHHFFVNFDNCSDVLQWWPIWWCLWWYRPCGDGGSSNNSNGKTQVQTWTLLHWTEAPQDWSFTYCATRTPYPKRAFRPRGIQTEARARHHEDTGWGQCGSDIPHWSWKKSVLPGPCSLFSRAW